MEKLLRPSKLDLDPHEAGAEKAFTYWLTTFNNFIDAIKSSQGNPIPDKLPLLINYISSNVFEIISDIKDYDMALMALNKAYVKDKNEIFSRFLLSSRRQDSTESLDEYILVLRKLSKDCKFKGVDAKTNSEEHIRDTFITGVKSLSIKQRLLEKQSLTLEEAINIAKALDLAEDQARLINSESNLNSNKSTLLQNNHLPKKINTESPEIKKIKACKKNETGNALRNVNKSHFESPKEISITASCAKQTQENQNNYANIPPKLKKSSIEVKVNGFKFRGLLDSCSTDSFISQKAAKQLGLKIYPTKERVKMAKSTVSTELFGYVIVTLEYQGTTIHDCKITVFNDLCSDILLGIDIMGEHSSLEIQYGGPKETLKVCNLASMCIKPPPLFGNLGPNVRPIADRSRRYSNEDQKFITKEIQRLLQEGIIEPSHSPWRAQVLVVKQNCGKKRLCVDYSNTINRYTYLDAYPLPKIEPLVNKIGEFKIYSSLDLKSAYHQIPVRENEKKFTGFEANGKLYQFCRIPFGITNGVASFQRVIDDIIEKEKLQATYAYVDNITVCGKTQDEHDKNLKAFYEAAKKYDITFNEDKSILSVQSLNLLGYLIQHGEIRPDPDRLKPLMDLPLPTDKKSLQRVMGLFSYYAQWIPQYGEKAYHLNQAMKSEEYPLNQKAIDSFHLLKNQLSQALRCTIQDDVPFTVETDASAHTIAATLNQEGRPVAFFSKTLNESELKYPSVEKEAYAIVECLKKWRHFLIGKPFKLITDQRSVSYMLDPKVKGKIKNEKISRWRIELSCFHFDIVYREGSENKAPDSLSRSVNCLTKDFSTLTKIHEALCHPGIARLSHYLRSKNLPYSIEEVKKAVGSCQICAKIKPHYAKPPETHLVKATQPFERLSIDFKGPLPSSSNNKYLLVVVDEYSRYPFAFPCKDTSSSSVIQCLTQIFSLFGVPSYIHSDRGSAFMSEELKSFLADKGIASSRSCPYNPTGNGQVERYNGVIWKAIQLAAASRNLRIESWELLLPDVLHSIRSLLCTSTNETPHERIFKFSRKSSIGKTIPSWLLHPGKVLLKRFVRHSKHEPLVDEVELLESNSQYAHIRHNDGRESTVSVKHLAPFPSDVSNPSASQTPLDISSPTPVNDVSVSRNDVHTSSPSFQTSPPTPMPSLHVEPQSASQQAPGPGSPPLQPIRRSTRQVRPPDRLNLFLYGGGECGDIAYMCPRPIVYSPMMPVQSSNYMPMSHAEAPLVYSTV